MKQKILQATKDILEKNLSILDEPFCDHKIVLVYDNNSELSKIVSSGYIENLEGYKNLDVEIINFDNIENDILKEKLMSLEEDSTVILVQSTNFRLDDFRLRLNLKNQGVGAIEHNHLLYIKENQYETYINSLVYQKDFYDKASDMLKNKLESSNTMKIVSKSGDELFLEGGFEEMKKNIGDFEGRIRAGTFPIGECFTEIKDFSKMNGKIGVRAFPNMDFEVQFPEVFFIEIKESLIIGYSENTPNEFIEIFDKIKTSEDNEVLIRELGFGLNRGITWEKPLNDVNAFERICGFHMSLGKKHQIYRKKIHRKIIQRYHIDIFPDVDYIELEGEKIFEKDNFII